MYWEHVPFFFFFGCICGILVFKSGVEPVSPALEAQSLIHRIAKEVLPIALIVTTSLVPHEGSWISLGKKKKIYIYIYIRWGSCTVGWLSGFCQEGRWYPMSVDRNQSSWGGGCLHQQNLKVRRIGVSLLAMEKTGNLETLPLNYLHSD